MFIPEHEDMLLTHHLDGYIRIWNIMLGCMLISIDIKHTNVVIDVDNKGKYIAIGSSDGDVQVYKTKIISQLAHLSFT